MQIIRIEHSDGQGLFMSYIFNEEGEETGRRFYVVSNLLYSVSQRHNDFHTPEEEGLILIRGVDFCAYKSLEQLNQWIMPEELKIIINHGFSVYMIEIDIFQQGNHQIVYKKKDILTKTDISSLFK